jgi:uncharacterized membrane protein
MELFIILIVVAVIIYVATNAHNLTAKLDELKQQIDRLERSHRILEKQMEQLRRDFQAGQEPKPTPAPPVSSKGEKLVEALTALPETPPASAPPSQPPTSFAAKPAKPFELPPLRTAAQTFAATTAHSAPPPLNPPPVATPPPAPAPATKKASFEMRLGTYWLVRIGIVMLLTSIAFFANYAYHHFIGRLGPIGKTSLLYLASGALLAAGAWWQRKAVKDSLKNYAQVLFAGGLAAVYFTTYAAYHIPPLRIINNAAVDGILLLLWAGVIAWLADRRKSEVMALFAVGLAFYTSIMTRVGDFTLYSNLVLTLTAVFFLVRNRWVNLSFVGMLASYASYAFWRFLHDDGWRWAQPDERLGFGAMFLLAYWLIFTAATFLSRSGKLTGLNRAGFLTLNNGAFFVLFLLTMMQVHSGGFWKFALAYGTALLLLAAAARKWLAAEPLTKNAYLTQGLLLATLGFITKFSGLHLSLVLAAESVILFITGRQRQSKVLQAFSYLAAVLATGWNVASLHQFNLHGLCVGTVIGALMTVNAVWVHRQTLEKISSSLRAETSVFIILAFINWLAVTYFNTTLEHRPLALALEAVAFTLSIYVLRVPEIVLLGQFFVILAAGTGVVSLLNNQPPWWNPLALIAILFGISHWWQKQKTLLLEKNVRWAHQGIYSVAAVAVAVLWLPPLMDAPEWLAVSSFLALGVTIYAVATRLWPLVAAAQIFLVISLGNFFYQLWNDKPAWFFPLAPLSILLVLSFGTRAWLARRPDTKAEIVEPVAQLVLLYRWLALAASLCWLWQYVPDRQHPAAYMAMAVAVFGFALWKHRKEALVAAWVYAVAAFVALWTYGPLKNQDFQMDVYWLNFLVLLAPFVLQQILARRREQFPLPSNVHAAIIIITGLSLWRFISCWAASFTEGFYLTITWAGLALAIFLAGMVLRERFYRWFGLGVLVAAVGRVIIVDVWKQETVYRILTFMALGVALLVIGFLYNKYEEKIRQWL